MLLATSSAPAVQRSTTGTKLTVAVSLIALAAGAVVVVSNRSSSTASFVTNKQPEDVAALSSNGHVSEVDTPPNEPKLLIGPNPPDVTTTTSIGDRDCEVR